MYKHPLSIILFFVSTILSSSAINISSTAGNIASLIENPDKVTELTVSGSINAQDLEFIANKMPELQTLDISAVNIEAYSGESVFGITNHAANMIPANSFVGAKLTSVKLPSNGNLALGNNAFAGSSVSTVELGKNISHIGDACFAGCYNLTNANIATNISGCGVFASCSNLKSVNISANIELGDYCFNNCISLSQISGSENINYIGNRAFTNCTSLTTFEFGNSLKSVGDEAFCGAGLTEANFNKCNSLEFTGDWSFAQMPAIEKIDLSTAKKIGNGVAFECKELRSFTTSDTYTTIGDFAYANNVKLDSVGIINDNTVSIGSYAMSGMNNITTLTLPATLEFIGDNGMERMFFLSKLNSNALIAPQLGENVWNEIDQSEIELSVLESSLDSYLSAEQWKNFNILVWTGIPEIILSETTMISARFEGDNLIVKVNGGTATAVNLYNTQGMLLDAVNTEIEEVVFNVTGHSNEVFIIGTILSNGNTASLKIAKL